MSNSKSKYNDYNAIIHAGKCSDGGCSANLYIVFISIVLATWISPGVHVSKLLQYLL